MIEEIVKDRRQTSGFRRRTSDLGPRTSKIRIRKPRLGLQGSSGKEGEELRASLAYAVERLRDLTGNRRVPGENAVPVLKAEAVAYGTAKGLGMAYEVTKVQVLDRRERVWVLTEVTFTGAAILRRNKAAYEDTWIELE